MNNSQTNALAYLEKKGCHIKSHIIDYDFIAKCLVGYASECANKVSPWISVDDALPIEDEPVLAYLPNNPKQFLIILVAHDGEDWREFESHDPNELYAVGVFKNITHWMPLPPIPLRLDLDMSN